ncbi:hypothetical protein RKD23_007673 [Streptomyces sp. SAI-170]|uniref:hypothetical protein n=1 Tax=Streptomyces sp. SAI-170 TaxID=3377729 RepID=UPI003C7A8181
MRYVDDQHDGLRLAATTRRLPAVLATLRLDWSADRAALLGMLAAQAAALLAVLA